MKQFGPTPQLLVTLDYHDPLELVMAELRQVAEWQNVRFPHPDVIIVNQDQSGLKIEQVRSLINETSYQPYQATERVVVLLHLDQASLPAQQALLKFLEEPPHYQRIIATTTQLEAIVSTIQSRCTVTFIHTPQTPATEQTPPNTQLTDFLATDFSYGEIIALSEQYKEREDAIIFLKKCLKELTTSSTYPNPDSVHASQIMLEHLGRLYQNANVRLTLENCLFTIKARVAKSRF
jgi:hypothetical protein